MPFEAQKIMFKNFMCLYTAEREKDWASLTSQLQSIYETGKAKMVALASYVGITSARADIDPTTIGKLQKTVDEIKDRIDRADSFDHWIKLIEFLREKAIETQNYKSNKTTDSLCSLTCHALAGCIIRELQKDAAFKPLFQNKINSINQLIETTIKKRDDEIRAGYRQNTLQYNRTIAEETKKLANYGDEIAIANAHLSKLFPELPNRSENETSTLTHSDGPGYPELYPDFVIWLFDKMYRTALKKDFPRFQEDSIKTYEDHKKAKANRENNAQISEIVLKDDQLSHDGDDPNEDTGNVSDNAKDEPGNGKHSQGRTQLLAKNTLFSSSSSPASGTRSAAASAAPTSADEQKETHSPARITRRSKAGAGNNI